MRARITTLWANATRWLDERLRASPELAAVHAGRVVDDFELLARWRAGDARAGRRLFRRQFPVLLRFYRNKVSSEAVERLVQRALLRCLEARPAARTDASFRAHLLAIARNVLYEHLGCRRCRVTDPLDMYDVAVSDLSPSPARRGRQRALLRALRALSIDDQIALELHYWEGSTVTELGAVLDLDEQAVRGRLQRATEELRRQLAEKPTARDR